MIPGVRDRLRLLNQSASTTLFLAVAVNAFGAGMFVPFALIYYQTVTELSASSIGLTLTMATLITLLVTPVTGILIDRFGARKLVILSQFVEALGFIGYLTVSSLPSLLWAALIATAGTRMFYASFSTLIAESTMGSDRDRWFGLIGITQTVGASLSGLFASIFIGSLGVSGFRVIILGTACCLVGSAFLLKMYRPRFSATDTEKSTGGYRVVLQDRIYLRLVATNIVFVLYSMLIGVGFAVFATSALQAPLWSVGALGILHTGLVIGLQTRITTGLQDQRRTKSMLLAGVACVTHSVLLALSLMVPTQAVVPFLLGVSVIFAISQLVYIPASRALAAELSPPESRGRHVAFFELSYGVAAAIAPAFFGIAFDSAPAAPWLCMSVLLLAAMVVLRGTESTIPIEQNLPTGKDRQIEHGHA